MNDREAKKFYNSKEWEQKRDAILERDHHECQDCVARLRRAAETGEVLRGWRAKINRATQVHHILELKERPDLRLEDSNLISLCRMDHNIRHGREPVFFKGRNTSEKFREKW